MTIEDLARDVESLKAENRRLKRWGGLGLLFGLVLCGIAMAPEEKVPEVVRARRFEVVEPTGKVQVYLASGGAGKSGVFLAAANGESVGSLAVRSDGLELRLTRHSVDGDRDWTCVAAGKMFVDHRLRLGDNPEGVDPPRSDYTGIQGGRITCSTSGSLCDLSGTSAWFSGPWGSATIGRSGHGPTVRLFGPEGNRPLFKVPE